MANHDKTKAASGEKDVESRLEALEETVATIRESHLDFHRWFITGAFTLMAVFVTLIFGGVGVFLAYTANQSHADLREDLKDMQDKVDKSIEQMNQNFKNVAGEALRKPLLTVANQNGFLDGQTIVLDQHRQIPLFPLFIKNEGDKKSGYISIRLFTSEDLQLQNSGTAQKVDINDKEFPFEYYFPMNMITGTSVDIAPTETWTFPNVLSGWNFYQGTTNQFINCKLDIYFDSDKPSEAKFRIKAY